MKKVNLADLAWGEWSSPGGKFHGRSKELSIALGAVRNATLAQGGHPFDLEYGRLSPGKTGCPYHRHSSQWELFLIVAGHGTVRHRGGHQPVKAGDAILQPPGAAHQLINTSDGDLDYLLIADNPLVDLWHYPDSNKMGYRPGGGSFRPDFVDYWLDEDPAAPTSAEPKAGFPWADTRFVDTATLPWDLRASPRGKYASHCRDISLALGGQRDVGVQGGGHPFDLQTRRVPAGAAICPLHAHTVQWECFIVVAGRATVRTPTGRFPIGPGDVVLQPPGTAHQVINDSPDEFVCHIVADNPAADIFHYPDSGKWGIKPQRKFFRLNETDYFEGEE
ncbi:MAG TPA: cupin domain-containing protein [Opitutaceae bacterium]